LLGKVLTKDERKELVVVTGRTRVRQTRLLSFCRLSHGDGWEGLRAQSVSICQLAPNCLSNTQLSVNRYIAHNWLASVQDLCSLTSLGVRCNVWEKSGGEVLTESGPIIFPVFLDGLKKLEQRSHKRVELRGNM
jgi:hypothetical protein